MASTYYYSEQIRRFLLQFARMFSNFEIESGLDANGNPIIIRVPVRYGDGSRQAETILQNNSRNSLPCAPMMSFYITDLKYRRQDVQEPHFIDRRYIRQREWDEDSQVFEENQANAFNVERAMPVPYMLSLNLDIWTSNTHSKLQLMEQILPLFNPSLEVQSTDNYLDWTSLSIVEIKNVNWSSRTVPNNEDNIDIATLKFELPIWISAPARVTKGGVVHKIIASMFDETGDYVDAITDDDILLGTRLKITPHGYQVILIGNELSIQLQSHPGDDGNINTLPDNSNSGLSWRVVLDEYGALNNGISQIRLEPAVEGEPDIIGTVTYHPDENSGNILLFTIDPGTMPSDTLSPIDKVIDPIESGPGIGLPVAALGQRYLLTTDTGDADDSVVLPNTNVPYVSAWFSTTELVAKKDDIIEYDGTNWTVVFTPNPVTVDYVTNLNTNIQFKTSGTSWLRSVDGLYSGGNWSVVF